MTRDELEILETLVWLGARSKKQLGDITQQSRGRLAVALEGLLAEGWLAPADQRASTGGRRASMFDLNRARGVLVGIDLEPGTATLVVMNMAQRELGKAGCDLLDGERPAAAMARVSRTLSDLLTKARVGVADVLAIGLSLPGPVDVATGLLMNPPNLPQWEGFSIRDHFTSDFPTAVVSIENDANTMALGELWHLRRATDQSGQESLVVVKMGPSGIGSGIVVGGRLLKGAHGGAGEIGHINVLPGGPRCGCGHEGCLEAVAGPPGMLRLGVAAANAGESAALKAVITSNGGLKLEDLARAARQGDESSNRIISEAGHRIGTVVASLVNIVDPERLVIAGQLAHVGPTMLAAIRQQVFGLASPISTGRLSINYAQSGSEGSLRGACIIAVLGLINA